MAQAGVGAFASALPFMTGALGGGSEFGPGSASRGSIEAIQRGFETLNRPERQAQVSAQRHEAALAGKELAEQQRQFNTQMAFRNRLLDLLGFGEEGGGLFAQLQPAGDVGDILAEVEGFGAGERARIEQQAIEQQQSQLAAAQSKGFGGSSFLSSVPLGIGREKELALQSLGDQLIGQRVGIREKGAERQIALANVLAQLLGGLV